MSKRRLSNKNHSQTYQKAWEVLGQLHFLPDNLTNHYKRNVYINESINYARRIKARLQNN